MPEIRVDINQLSMLERQLNNMADEIRHMVQEVSNAKNRLDWEIPERHSINERISNIHRKASQMESHTKSIEAFVDKVAKEFVATDKGLCQSLNTINGSVNNIITKIAQSISRIFTSISDLGRKTINNFFGIAKIIGNSAKNNIIWGLPSIKKIIGNPIVSIMPLMPVVLPTVIGGIINNVPSHSHGGSATGTSGTGTSGGAGTGTAGGSGTSGSGTGAGTGAAGGGSNAPSDSNTGGVANNTSGTSNYDVSLQAALDKQMKQSPQIQKNGKWVNASREEVMQYLNPSNNDEGAAKYQFLDLSAPAGVNKEDMAKYLSGKGILSGKADTYLEAAKKYNVSEVYLAAHSALETGNGTSVLAKGVVVNGVTVYNMYGIGAYDSDPIGGGAQYAYKMGWTTPEKAIEGGAKWISEQYINNPSYEQNTLYKMRWNPASPGQHQYATDVGWAVKQTSVIKKMYDSFPSASLRFDTPTYG